MARDSLKVLARLTLTGSQFNILGIFQFLYQKSGGFSRLKIIVALRALSELRCRAELSCSIAIT